MPVNQSGTIPISTYFSRIIDQTMVMIIRCSLHEEIIFVTFDINSINLNVDSNSDKSGETTFQHLICLHASNSNYNKR